MLMTIKETAFRLHCPLKAELKGLRITAPEDDYGFAKARVWVEPGHPMMSNLVEARLPPVTSSLRSVGLSRQKSTL